MQGNTTKVAILAPAPATLSEFSIDHLSLSLSVSIPTSGYLVLFRLRTNHHKEKSQKVLTQKQ